MSPRLLVLDGYDEAGRDALKAAGASLAGPLYERMLRAHAPAAHIDVVRFASGRFTLPRLTSIESYDGIAWTGANLTVHEDTPAVREQIAFARAAFAAGVPQFGSCWAVHVAVTAAGGRCAANPKGREFGVARSITLSEAGRAHPMYAGKPGAFQSFTSHEDHVVEVGAGTTVLAGNAFAEVQSVEVKLGPGTFWAVQYHPEYTLTDVARLAVARGAQLIAQDFFRDTADVHHYVEAFETLDWDGSRTDIAFRHGITEDVTEDSRRTVEVARWLEAQVAPRSAARVGAQRLSAPR